MNVRIKIIAIATLLTPITVHAQADDPDLVRAYAAGYKAQFLCSGLFNGGKSVAQIEREELRGIYPGIAEIVPTLKADIDTVGKTVSVAFTDDIPPRMAIHNPATGCTAQPIGWRPTSKRQAPQLTRLVPGALDDQRWPMGDKPPSISPTAVPAEARLAEQVIWGTKSFGGNTSAIIVVKNGWISAEEYKRGHNKHTSQRTWSVAKSIAGTYVGFIRQLTDLPVDMPDKDAGAEDPRRNITIDNLLRMASGLHSDTAGNRTDAVYMGGGAVDEWTTQWPALHKPGVKFRYANNDTLRAVMRAQKAQKSSGGTIHPHMLFDKLGMTRTFAETDWKGNYILSSQVWTTSRDLARLGMLYLNNGKWNGEQLLPKNWREYVSTPSGPQPDRKFGYGATFWLMNESDGIPKDTFAGFGNRGQYLVIIPSMDMVIVRRGYDSRDNRFDIEAFTRAIVAAVKN